MDFQTINHKWLYKEVVFQLENYIRLNELKIGDRLPTERYLSEQLGISRGTVREAYRTLEVNGIIESRPGGGRFLKTDLNQPNFLMDIASELDHADARDLFELREVIELRLVELVIERATDEEIAAIQDILTSYQDPYETDNAFHLALAESAHNNAFYLVIKYTMSLLAQVRQNYLKRPDRSAQMHLEHQSLVDALLQRDKNKARQIMHRHLNTIDLHYK